jgi:hypothetical protein
VRGFRLHPSVKSRERGGISRKRAPSLGLGFWISDVEGVGHSKGELIGQGGRTSHERGPQKVTRLIRVAKEERRRGV